MRRLHLGTITASNDPVTITRHLDRDQTDLGKHGRRPGPIAHIRRPRSAAVFVTEVHSQIGVPCCLNDVLRELGQQATRPDQAHTLLPGLRTELFCKSFVINNLSGHRINHLVSQHVGRVRHGHLLSNQAEPHTPFSLQSRL